jgi:hypothetical protein
MKAVYTPDTPTRPGMYWYLSTPEANPSIVRIFRDTDGYMSVQYDTLQVKVDTWDEESDVGVDYLANYAKGDAHWSHISQPAAPVAQEA